MFSVLLGLLVYGAALAIYSSMIRPGLEDPVLAVGVPVYIIWLSTTVSHKTKTQFWRLTLVYICKVWKAGVSQAWVMFTGAVLFMVSDCIIGINKFYTRVDNSQVE